MLFSMVPAKEIAVSEVKDANKKQGNLCISVEIISIIPVKQKMERW